MAKRSTVIELEIDTIPVKDAAEDMSFVLSGIKHSLKGVQVQLDKTFGNSAVDMEQFSRTLSDVLKTLQTNLGELKAAVSYAAAPIGAVLVPVLSRAVQGAAALVKNIGLVIGALLGTDQITESAKAAEKAEKKLEQAARSAGKAAGHSLASFDQIERLQGRSGSSTGGSSTPEVSVPVQVLPETVTDTLSPQLQQIVDKILTLIEPVKNIDFSFLTESVGKLGKALGELGGIISQNLEWVWFSVLVPLGSWSVQEAAPAAVDLLTGAFELLSRALEPVLSGFQILLPYLEPVIGFMGQTAVKILVKLEQQFQKLGATFEEKGWKIQQIFLEIGRIVTAVWEWIEPIICQMADTWGGILEEFGSNVNLIMGLAMDMLHGLVKFVAGVLTSDWERAWKGLTEIFKGSVNLMIAGVNMLISGMVGGLNGVISALNKISFTLPEWDILGSLAGQWVGLDIAQVTAPQIPYLARGAVLPANKPFLAMVGDQRHGTNVEAPLATIQEAVALVMEDLQAENQAGQAAILQVLQELLNAVLGIQVGDDVIGRAVLRYNRKMAVVKGGI